MFFSSVIGIDLQSDFDALLVSGLDELLEGFRVADLAVDGLEVDYVSAERILTRGLEDGSQDDGASASDQIGEVAQLVVQAGQIADSVAVRIFESADVDL